MQALMIVAAIAAGGFASDAPPSPSLVELETRGGALRAAVAPQVGGELASLAYRYRGRWIELLYRGRDYSPTNDWTGRAPLLWPAAGRTIREVAEGPPTPGWETGGRIYEMPLHGFARDVPWSIEGRGPDRLVVALRDGSITRRYYPFGFRIACEYRLGFASIELRYSVTAASDNAGPMPFSIGNHMTFNVPLVPGGAAGAVKVLTPARILLPLDANGRPIGTGRPEYRFRDGVALSLLAPKEAIPLGGYRKTPRLRLVDPAGLSIAISHNAAPSPSGSPVAFNLWGDVPKGFFSPEPWAGRQNSLVTGDGLVRLAPGKQFRWTVKITVEAASPAEGRRRRSGERPNNG